MKIFVGYSTIDNPPARLRKIERILEAYGAPYIDEIHFDPEADRETSVLHRVRGADRFMAVITPNFLRTYWTLREFDLARELSIPMMALIGDEVVESLTSTEVKALAGRDNART